MAKLKLSKSALQQERNQLKLYERTLPSLDLKRRQLSVELNRARREYAETRQAMDELETTRARHRARASRGWTWGASRSAGW